MSNTWRRGAKPSSVGGMGSPRQLSPEIERVWRRELGELLICLTSHTQIKRKPTKNSSSRKLLGVASANRGDYRCSGCAEFARLREPLVTIGYETFIRHDESPPLLACV